MFVELFGLARRLAEEWRGQRASLAELDLTAFDWDYVAVQSCGGGFQPLGLIAGDVCVRSMDDWLRLKPLFAFREERIDWNEVQRAQAAQADGVLIVASIPAAGDIVGRLMGVDTGAGEPEVVGAIVQTVAETAYQVLERISGRVVIDQVSLHERWAGPGEVGQQVKRLTGLLAERGTGIVQQHATGDIMPMLEELLGCGVNSVLPVGSAGVVDIVQIRRRFGRRMATVGGIDAQILRQGKSAIRGELERKLLPALAKQGGVVFGLDQPIPAGVPLEHYRYYVDTARDILGLPPRMAEKQGWRPMAF